MLNYILSLAQQAIAWAQGAWERAGQVLNQALDFARGVLNTAISAARSFAEWAYNSAVSLAQSLAAYAIQTAQNLFTSIYQTALNWYYSARSFAQTLYYTALAFAAQKVGEALAFINSVRDWLSNLIQGAIATINSIITWLNQQLTYLWGRLKSLADIMPALNLGTLLDYINSMYGTLRTFVSNPMSFIGAIIIGTFMDVLEWSVAYALGAVEVTLPPWPDIFNASGGALPYPSTGPPPQATGLGPPLTSIRVSGYTYGPGHPGIDLGLGYGQPVYAMHAGRVTQSGWSDAGYGYFVSIDGGEWWTRYAHLQEALVEVGQDVHQGDRIGLGDSTGNSTGPHLHLEIKHSGYYVDPLTVL